MSFKHLFILLTISLTLVACSDPDTSPNTPNNSDTHQDTSLQDTNNTTEDTSLQDTNTTQDTSLQDTNNTTEDTSLQDTNTTEDADDNQDAKLPPETHELTGILDDTFAPDSNTPGIFTGPAHTRNDGSGLAIDTDNNILVAGRGRLTPENLPADSPKMFTLRVDESGALDPTFGNTAAIPGLTTLALGPEGQQITVLQTQLQSDNKTVTCGNVRGEGYGVSHLVVTRLNPDGTPDPTFGNIPARPGITYIDAPDDQPNSLCWALKILDDGKILVGGQASARGTLMPLLLRLNSDGTPDPNFGNAPGMPGITLHDIAPTNTWIYAQVRQFSVLSSGKILALIHSSDVENSHLNGYLFRFNADGTVDNTFELTSLELPGNASHESIDFTVHPTTGQIFVAGRVETNSAEHPIKAFVHALTADGQTDPTFPTYILADIHASARAILVQPDGKIIAVGSSITHPDANFEAGNLFAVRLNLDGQLDPTFATDGIFSYQSATLFFFAARAQLDAKNRLVITGSTPIDNDQSPRGHTFITRLR